MNNGDRMKLRTFFKGVSLLVILLLAFAAGWVIGRRVPAEPTLPVAAKDAPRQLWTCSMHPQVIREEPGYCPICHMKLVPLTAPASSGSRLTVDPATVQNMGVRLATVQRGPLIKTVRAAGYLTAAEPLRFDVNLRLSGWIEKLSADTLGMPIAKGQKLFELYSPQLTVAVGELISTHQAKASVGQAASPAARAADGLYQAARQKLRLWGLSQAQVDQLATLKTAPRTIPFFSPADGVLAEKDVVEGSAVQSGQRIMRIIDYRTLWLDAQVHAQDMSWVHMNQPVEAIIDGLPGQMWRGQVIFIDPKVNPVDRTTTVRVKINNPNLKLRPGMFATVRLKATAKDRALLAPRSAVIDTGQRQVAFVSLGQGRFQPRDVEMGLVGSGDTVEILGGLSAGEQVVVSGQFFLDSDSRMQEAVRQFLQGDTAGHSNHAEPTTAPSTSHTSSSHDQHHH